MNRGRALILTIAVVSLASCSSGKSTSTSTTTAGTGATSASAGTVAGTAVTVDESEFVIKLGSKTFTAGTYTFKITNHGKFPHNLTIEGPGIQDKVKSATFSTGSAGDLTVNLQKGSYDFSCSVDSHKSKGMDLTVKVT